MTAKTPVMRGAQAERFAMDFASAFLTTYCFFPVPNLTPADDDFDLCVDNDRVYQLLSTNAREVLVLSAIPQASSSRESL